MNTKSELLAFIDGIRARVDDGSIVGIGLAACQVDGSILTAWKSDGCVLQVMAATAQLQYRLCALDDTNENIGGMN